MEPGPRYLMTNFHGTFAWLECYKLLKSVVALFSSIIKDCLVSQ